MKKDKLENIAIGEDGDILSKYKIPVHQNIDPNLALPEDSDSSRFSSDDNQKPGTIEHTNKKKSEGDSHM